MSETNHNPEQAAALRRQAEEQFQVQKSTETIVRSDAEVEKIIHELRVHQIELEMQNDELRQTQEELQTSRARYIELYEHAPVGYMTLSEKGIILESNLTAATMLEMPRNTLTNQPISQLILDEDQDIYYLHRKKLFETGDPQSCELRMRKADQTAVWVRLQAIAARDSEETPICRITLSDISARKKLDHELALHIRETELFNKASVGRELRMIELKKEINALCRELGKKEPYPNN